MNNSTVHQEVTDRIIAKIRANIDAGDVIAPWQKPWATIEGLPKGAAGNEYRGINLFLLSMMGYANPYWLTFNKVAGKKVPGKGFLRVGGMKGPDGKPSKIKAGEKGTTVIFWKPFITIDKETGEKKTIFILRTYVVFNAEQCENLPSKYLPAAAPARPIETMEKAQAIVSGWPINLKHEGGRAFYSPACDSITMPARESFKTCGHYYGTLFHEMIHATGHKSRLDRDFKGCFGSEPYAFEELVAEMGAAMLCAHAGIEGLVENSVAYLQNWMRKLQDNPDWLVKAAGKAQKAVDLILGIKWGDEATGEGDDSEGE